MNVKLASKVEASYLLIEVSGSIVDINQLKQLTMRFYDEITKSGIKNVIIDERKTQFPMSVEHSSEITNFLSQDFPNEIKYLKIAFVMNDNFKAIGEFFQFQANKAGYNFEVFTSMEEAYDFIKE